MHPDDNTPDHPKESEAPKPDPPLLQPIEAVPTERESEPEKQHAEQPPQPQQTRTVTELLSLRWWLKASNVVIAVATVANVVVAYWQFSAINESNNEARRSADAALIAAKAAELQVKTIRPWIRVNLQPGLLNGNGFISQDPQITRLRVKPPVYAGYFTSH